MLKTDAEPLEKSENILPVEQWLQTRKEAARTLDPETAEVAWAFNDPRDPYWLRKDDPHPRSYLGRVHYARSPESEIWVAFADLPNGVRERLREKHS